MPTRSPLLACACLAVAGTATAAAAAAAADPEPVPALLSGGAVAPAPGAFEQPRNVLVALRRGGGRLELSAHAYATCAGSPVGFRFRASVPAGRAFDVARRLPAVRGRTASVRLTGERPGAREATGTLTIRGGGCRASTVRYAVAAPAASAPAPTRTLEGGRLYVGDSGARGDLTRHAPVVLRTRADGAAFRHVLYAVGMRCGARGTYGFGESFGPAKLDARGRFDASNRQVLRESDGTTTRRVTFTGQARGPELSATLRVRVVVRAGGRTVRACDTGTLRFRATAVPLP